MRKILKYGFVFFGIIVSSFTAEGQIHPETAFYWENPYVINPASVELDYTAYFSVAARKQWAGLKGAPETFFATGKLYLEDYHTQAGLKVLKDKIGYIHTLDFSLSYAYVLRLSWNSFLNLGIAGAWQTQHVDREEVQFDDSNDPVFSSERFKGLQEWNAHLGVEYVYDRSLALGASCQHLFSFFKDDPHIWGGSNYFYGRYRTRTMGRGYRGSGHYRSRSFPRSFDVEYGVCVKQYEDDFQVDGMVSLYINEGTQTGKFQLSLFGRSVGEIGVLAGIKLISELKLLCTYDYNFKSIRNNSYGSFEVMLAYPIHRTSTCRSEWDR